jgi:hypothetical protein
LQQNGVERDQADRDAPYCRSFPRPLHLVKIRRFPGLGNMRARSCFPSGRFCTAVYSICNGRVLRTAPPAAPAPPTTPRLASRRGIPSFQGIGTGHCSRRNRVCGFARMHSSGRPERYRRPRRLPRNIQRWRP